MKKEISLEHAADLIEIAIAETGKKAPAFTVSELIIIHRAIELALNEQD